MIVAALDGDFRRRPFHSVLSLVPLAESVVKLSAICDMCHENASFSMKLDSSREGSPAVVCHTYIRMPRQCPILAITGAGNSMRIF